MLEPLKQRVHRFMAEPSGSRFRARFERHRADAGALHRALTIAIGLALIAVGIALLVLPGPGLMAIALGAMLIAGESKWAAVRLDRLDVFLTHLWARWR